MKTLPIVNIIIVNYRNWEDTIECIESILHCNYASIIITVIDNGSENGSFDFLLKWLKGELSLWLEPNNYFRKFVCPGRNISDLCKQVYYCNDKHIFQKAIEEDITGGDGFPRIILIRNFKNDGFAAANNIAIKFAQNHIKPDYYWFLNNDTVIRQDTLSELLGYAEKAGCAIRHIGIIGACLMEYDRPEIIQSLGGKYIIPFGLSYHIGAGRSCLKFPVDQKMVNAQLNYINGASMFVLPEFITETGLQNEQYFLYGEEIDWSIRAKKKKWYMEVCLSAKVYHKGSSTIVKYSKVSDYYSIRAKIRIVKKYYPYYLPFIYLSAGLVIVNRIRRYQFSHIPVILRAIIDA